MRSGRAQVKRVRAESAYGQCNFSTVWNQSTNKFMVIFKIFFREKFYVESGRLFGDIYKFTSPFQECIQHCIPAHAFPWICPLKYLCNGYICAKLFGADHDRPIMQDNSTTNNTTANYFKQRTRIKRWNPRADSWQKFDSFEGGRICTTNIKWFSFLAPFLIPSISSCKNHFKIILEK